MSDKCPKCGAPIIDEQSSWVIYSCDSHLHRKHGYLERGEACSQKEIYQLQAQLAQLREQFAKAEAERPMTNGYAYHSLASQVEYAINLLDGNEDESDSPGGELVEKLIDHLNHYEAVKLQLAKAEAEAKRYREAWASVRKQWDNEATIAAGWNVPSGDRLASLLRQCIDDMDALVPPTEQGTTHD